MTTKLSVTLLALMARLWLARHYSPGVQAQVLMIFVLVLLGWSGYVSRIAHEERLSAMAHLASTMSSHILGQVWKGAGR
jgi:hypothetical protein